MPIRRSRGRRPEASWPSMKIAPESGRSRPATSRRSVVFPAPEGPSRQKLSPAEIPSETPRSASVSPIRLATDRSSMETPDIHSTPRDEGRRQEQEKRERRDRLEVPIVKSVEEMLHDRLRPRRIEEHGRPDFAEAENDDDRRRGQRPRPERRPDDLPPDPNAGEAGELGRFKLRALNGLAQREPRRIGEARHERDD